ncbi:hypothetical protein ACQEWB_03145 [Streptomyces sp. CA-249302]|uniref:hypothetical protein n=1 Tax=Streptomyces sp. CA-249302 TaxID=3240058 RepID=UPI003D8F947E
MTGTLLFGLSSLVCGLAWTAPALIVARAVQGVSAAVMAGGFGATAALPALSPVLLRESRTEQRARSYDPFGALTATAALVAGGNLVVFLLGASAFGMSYTLSRYGQGVLGYSPLSFGLANAVMPVGAVVGSYAGQALVTRIGARPVAATGLSLVGLRHQHGGLPDRRGFGGRRGHVGRDLPHGRSGRPGRPDGGLPGRVHGMRRTRGGRAVLRTGAAAPETTTAHPGPADHT